MAPYKRPIVSTNRCKLPTERDLPKTDELLVPVTVVSDIHGPAEEIESSMSGNGQLVGGCLWEILSKNLQIPLVALSRRDSVLTEAPQSRTIQRADDIASETPFFSLIRINQLDDHPFSSTRHP